MQGLTEPIVHQLSAHPKFFERFKTQSIFGRIGTKFEGRARQLGFVADQIAPIYYQGMWRLVSRVDKAVYLVSREGGQRIWDLPDAVGHPKIFELDRSRLQGVDSILTCQVLEWKKERALFLVAGEKGSARVALLQLDG